jgi:hypothetical protein
LKEVYISKGTRDTPTCTVNLYYSKKLNYLKESISKKLDSAKQMKLNKLEILIHEFYSSKEKKTFPPSNFRIELKEIKVKNTELITSYLDRYLRENGN